MRSGSRTWRRVVDALSIAGALLSFSVAYLIATIAAFGVVAAFLVFVVTAIGAATLFWARFIDNGTSLVRKLIAEDKTAVVVTGLGLCALATSSFTGLSVALYELGMGRNPGSLLHGEPLVRAAFNSYLWHLVDAIPLLDIPGTVHWTLVHPFTDHIQGALTVLYTLVVIVPAIYFLAAAYRNVLEGAPEDG